MNTHAQNRGEVIQLWIDRVTAYSGPQNYDDLHIYDIDPEWKLREHWISGGISALTLASSLQQDPDRIVVLGVSLQSEDATFAIPASTEELKCAIGYDDSSIALPFQER